MLFAGEDSNFKNDLWSFDTTTLPPAWTNISPGNGSNGTYGVKGVASGSNFPGARWGATAHTDAAGNLWLFGGFGYGATGSTPGLLNDLWEYTAGQWVWISGSNAINQDGVYGALGTPNPLNVPGGRQTAVSWVDSSGNFWLFGGYNLSGTGQPDAFNDLWEYTAGQWTWVSGSSTVNQPAVYGVQGTAAASNVPGARWASASWIDSANRLWLFGGEGNDTTATGPLSDLWEYSAGQWTWVKGPNSTDIPGTYGLVPSAVDYPHVVNFPGARWAPGYWTYNGEFFMFGGEGFDSTTTSGGIGLMNDLWRYLPYP
jgi:N-acetylneuraminic acid mutarotase